MGAAVGADLAAIPLPIRDSSLSDVLSSATLVHPVHKVAPTNRLCTRPDSASNNAHKLTVLRPLFLKLHVTLAFCEQRMVTADADIHTRMHTCATLANNDVSGNDFLAAENLDAQSFGF